MQSSTPSPQTFKHNSQDITRACSEEMEVRDDHDNDRGLELGSPSLQANSTPRATTEEAIAVDSVNRLPVDMLSEIFIACAHTFDQSELTEMNRQRIPSHHYRLIFAPNAVPFTISSVCKRWRSIGLSTPKLWSKFTISGRDRKLDNVMVALRTWLKRSENYPLQFTYASGYRAGDEVFIELFKNIYRWHIAYFKSSYVSYVAMRRQCFENDGSKAESLVTLEFNPCYPSLNIAFQRFPNLRRLRIHPDCLAVEEARSLSLTHLALTALGGDTATFFSYLRRFPSLISFEAPVHESKDDWSHLPLTPFTHTTLTELTITEYQDNIALRDILANIHLPSIHRLCLKYRSKFDKTQSQRVEMANVVNDFIRRHESTFTDLELSGLYITSDEMIETLRMFPRHLTSYQSYLWDVTDECVKRLTLNPLDPTHDLASNLSSISLHVRHRGPSGDLLAEMILSRWARNPHTTFELQTRYTGLNPLLDSRIARRVQDSPGLLLLYQ